jgi:cytochrome c-type biogenesis protein CcmH/NrfF
MKRLSAIGVLLIWSACFAVWAQETELLDDEKVARITGNLVCQCGCATQMVRSCACPTAIGVTLEVRKLVAGGLSEEEIFAQYEEEYGHQVLGAPRAEGFNLLGWFLPFIAAGLGTVIVVTVAKRLKPTQNEALETTGKSTEMNAKYRKLLDQELKDW